MRVAVIDIGTNTVLMTIADAASGAILRDEHAIARLGEGVDKTRRISDEAYKRFAEIMRRYRGIIDELAVERVVPFATSAMRDATNRDEVITRTARELGYNIELLSGAEEARWSFVGSLYGIDKLEGVVATIDIGGGSTEVSVGHGQTFDRGTSIDIGAVRIKERFFHPMNDSNADAARAFIREQLLAATSSIESPSDLIAVAGTPTSLAAMKHKLASFDASIVDGTVLTHEEVVTLTHEILHISSEELTRRYPAVLASRADILPAGALILEEAMKALNVSSVRVSTKGLRYGVLVRELDR
ncbi:MAG: Ppx/GppA family phosphatase [Bacteroidetes bacterium]|nr:Ppx/GppA family phosphatase [Bacteroidota bacterium]